ncbi:vanadium-dependent haloperoxidase, partial [Antribacter gilvus]|uniref:vanadium-dependent haloperoxidase n=1 Tax=Antribacter gilvus TaxID=2304675 RepID=UPI000F770E76
MTSGSQFRLPAPAGATSYAGLLASPVYQEQLAEVRSLGGATSTTRTAEQRDIAFFWANDTNGTYKPPGHMLEITQTVAQSRNVTDARAVARLFAEASLAMGDAGIAVRDQKFLTSIDLWRPESAINEDPILAQRDPSWQPLLTDPVTGAHVSPCFPAYTSGHATFAGAWAAVMAAHFGDAVTFTAGTDDPHMPTGYTRTFTSFSQAAAENARSRVYLGVHFQFDADGGLQMGGNIGRWV